MNFWDNRFSAENYIYGEQPNTQFKQFIDKLEQGRILLPGEGEGRNGVYAATKGWEVVAIDQSNKGKEKTLELAKRQQVDLKYIVGDIFESNLEKNSFDAIALIFLHLPSDIRESIHQFIQNLLRPGGKLLLVGFSQDQLKYTSGGPKSLNMLYTCEMLQSDFSNLKIEKNTQQIVDLQEGIGHNGEGSIITCIAEKL